MYGILRYDHSVWAGLGVSLGGLWAFCLLYTVLWITVKEKGVIECVKVLCCKYM